MSSFSSVIRRPGGKIAPKIAPKRNIVRKTAPVRTEPEQEASANQEASVEVQTPTLDPHVHTETLSGDVETTSIPHEVTAPVVEKVQRRSSREGRKHASEENIDRVVNESRISIRAQVWGMNLRFNPPTIWATINLSDTGDPIAQVLCGQDIDLDRFVATAGPMS